mgnify:CR=1 FL=1
MKVRRTATAKRVTQSKDPAKVWERVRDVMNPRSSQAIKLKAGAREIEANTSATNRSPNVVPLGVGLGQRGKRLDAELDL